MFKLSQEPLGSSAGCSGFQDGASVRFEGVVRDHNEGRKVVALEYEAFDELAETEGEKVLREAKDRFPISRAECVHRVGKLALGDVAVRVEVWSGHREEAFAACRYIIDEIKHRVPIWKKEFYEEGE